MAIGSQEDAATYRAAYEEAREAGGELIALLSAAKGWMMGSLHWRRTAAFGY